MTTTFRSRPERYEQNHRESIMAAARPALIDTPHGDSEEAVAIMVGDHPRLVLTRDHAYRVALAIANILTNQREPTRI